MEVVISMIVKLKYTANEQTEQLQKVKIKN